ncbi:hypothetical protein KFL_000460100 [Klebsormidium nitens]|uniref:Uncharacterized protein n=1 Tax=Klebsormidium nitens TaxID=105231 RepID=A0A1Y1HN86_KLENI|nr:hypothetical protein KFL_000460100 [Klebsormidium nitens]|eukprot:GAQ80100.1 hypothetical protein KFL_000460100 [Klebsormidium nitens]
MAHIAIGGPLCLLLVLAALASHVSAADSVLGASFSAFGGNRKLLQSGSSGSTVFGTPPAGTLVVTWNPVPAKHSDSPDFGKITSPPYQYDWLNIYPISSSCENCTDLWFYPVEAYVAGSNGQKTQLTSSGGCDIATRQYPDLGSLFTSCTGSFSVPNNGTLAVTQVWDLLVASDDLQFQVPTPLAYFNCIAFFFGGASTPSAGLTNFQASFDTGPIPIKPSTSNNLPPTFSNIGFESLPFTETGALTFKSINMRLSYDPPVPVQSFGWSLPYTHCTFSGVQNVAVQSVAVPPVAAPPTGQLVGGTCDPRSSKPNQCFNAPGNSYVCCPGQCSANPGPTPACAPPAPATPGALPIGGTCDPNSNKPNQCFNADGSSSVCCPGQCPASTGASPACS